MEGALLGWGGPPGGISKIADVPQVVHDLGQGQGSMFDDTPRCRPGDVRRDSSGSVRAAGAPGKRGPAVLAAIDLEGGELPALPTQDLGRRAQRLDKSVELTPGLRIGGLSSLGNRRTTPLGHRGRITLFGEYILVTTCML